MIAFNEESARSFWQQLLEHETNLSLKTLMKAAQFHIEAHSIRIMVGTIIARETLRAELKLDEKLRQTFADKNIQFHIEVDPSLADREEKKPQKLFSAREKWELMVERNPKLMQFKEKLQLKPDED